MHNPKQQSEQERQERIETDRPQQGMKNAQEHRQLEMQEMQIIGMTVELEEQRNQVEIMEGKLEQEDMISIENKQLLQQRNKEENTFKFELHDWLKQEKTDREKRSEERESLIS